MRIFFIMGIAALAGVVATGAVWCTLCFLENLKTKRVGDRIREEEEARQAAERAAQFAEDPDGQRGA
jgi:hypothetical protein